MNESVSAWQQSGNVYLWRYPQPSSKSRRGWHFTADTAGCVSMVDLLERMQAADGPCHRTLALGAVAPEISAVPNFGPPKPDRFEKLRINYAPEATELTLTEDDGRLNMNIGADRATVFAAAFVEVGVGLGDFGIATSRTKCAETWMFWWMPELQRH